MATRNRSESRPKQIRGENNLEERIDEMMDAANVAEEIANHTMNSEERDKT